MKKNAMSSMKFNFKTYTKERGKNSSSFYFMHNIYIDMHRTLEYIQINIKIKFSLTVSKYYLSSIFKF